jgi:hypothetical protein
MEVTRERGCDNKSIHGGGAVRNRGVGVTGILLALMIGAWAAPAAGADTRSYAPTHFGLELDGSQAGIISGFEGGVPYGEVVELASGPDRIVRKQIAALRYEDITITAPFDMEKNFFQWIQDTIAGKAQGRNGAIVTYDYQSKALARMEFIGALISEITLPKVDLASKTAVFLTVKIRPQFTRYVAPQGGNMAPLAPKTRIPALSQNFRLRIDGLEQATTYTSSVDAVTVKVDIAQNTVGDARAGAAVPGRIRVSNVAATTRNVKPLYDWLDIFLLRGTRNAVKNGTLEYVDMRTGKPVLAAAFRNLGLVKIVPVAAGGAAAARSASPAGGEVRTEMYCEEISIVSQ